MGDDGSPYPDGAVFGISSRISTEEPPADQLGRRMLGITQSGSFTMPAATSDEPVPISFSDGENYEIPWYRIYNAILDGQPNDHRMLIMAAGMTGFTIHVLSGSSSSIVSPDEKAKHTLRADRPMNEKHVGQVLKSILIHGDPFKVELLKNHQTNSSFGFDINGASLEVNLSDQIKRELLGDQLPEDPAPTRHVEKVTCPYCGRKRVKRNAHGQLYSHEMPESVRACPLRDISKDTPMQTSPPPPTLPYIVRPFLSHYHVGTATTPGKSYPSRHINEHHYPDGTVKYGCPQCKQEWDKPTSVRTHSRVHGTGTDPELIKRSLIEDPTYQDVAYSRRYTPRQARVDALAEYLESLGDMTPEEAARAALQWVHEQSEQNSTLAGEREPLSAEQILDRVRRLVDQGDYFDQREVNERLAMEAAQRDEELATTRAELEAARHAEQVLRDQLAPLHELLGGMLTTNDVTETDTEA